MSDGITILTIVLRHVHLGQELTTIGCVCTSLLRLLTLCIRYCNSWESEIDVDKLPDALTRLAIHSIKTPISKFPLSLVELSFGHRVDKPINKLYPQGRLPDSIRLLRFVGWFNWPLGEQHSNGEYYTYLPSHLKSLMLGDGFNQSLDNLPVLLVQLTIGDHFNRSVNNLPTSLIHLTIGDGFNRSVNNLPQSLTHLTLGNQFNRSINKLPRSLTHLTLGNRFNRPINDLPQSLTHLTIGDRFDQTVDNLPPSIVHLVIKRQPVRGL